MSLIVYSNCHIRFESHDDDDDDEESSLRSLIEIRDLDDGTYKIQALDLDNNKREIFNIPFTLETKYDFGRQRDEPDKIQNSDGIYYISLNVETRESFHTVLTSIREVLNPQITRTTDSKTQKITTDNTSALPKESSEQKRTFTSDPVYCNPKDILVEIHNLNQSINEGKSTDAAEIASELAKKGVYLQAKDSEKYKREESFQILVQFDGNQYGIDQIGAQIPVNVYRSTTIRELRAIFEHAYHYLPQHQYFFVNGKLAHDDDTMTQLNVGPKSLFILFLITYPRQFKKQGPWACPLCTVENSEENLTCFLCSAVRKE